MCWSCQDCHNGSLLASQYQLIQDSSSAAYLVGISWHLGTSIFNELWYVQACSNLVYSINYDIYMCIQWIMIWYLVWFVHYKYYTDGSYVSSELPWSTSFFVARQPDLPKIADLALSGLGLTIGFSEWPAVKPLFLKGLCWWGEGWPS